MIRRTSMIIRITNVDHTMALLKRLVPKAPLVRFLASGSRDKLDLSFNNPKDAFKSKTTSELVRAYVVYQLCSVNWIVENNAMLMKKAQNVLGRSLFEMLMRATFYGQFVAGADAVDIKPTVDRLKSFGVKSILDYSVEEDMTEAEEKEKKSSSKSSSKSSKHAAEDSDKLIQYKLDDTNFAARRYKLTSARTYFYKNEEACEKNMEAFLKSIDAVHKTTNSTGFMAVKLTALGKPSLLLKLSEVIMRARNYMQQMDGGKGNVLTHHKTVEDFQRYFGDNKDKPEVQKFLKNITTDSKGVVHLFPWSNIVDHDMNLSDTFRVPDPKTGQMRRLISQITKEEEAMFRNMLLRLDTVLEAAKKVSVRVMIDAEQTYFQPAISRITLELQRKYNKDKSLVFNTYQCYLKNTYNELMTDLEQAQRQNFKWAAKLVRGAYMEQERARAAAMGYEDPVCETYEATSASYHKCLKEVLDKANGSMKGKINVMAASHNEDTVRYGVTLMQEMGLKREDKILCFGQLLGMCDHVTFPLGQAGYSVYKYVPYGPVLEVLPYLSRRANENRGFLSKIKKEKRLLLKEIFRRATSGQLFYKPDGKYTPA